MSENFTVREQLKTNFKINLLFSILWANPQGVTRAQMSQISGDVQEIHATKGQGESMLSTSCKMK